MGLAEVFVGDLSYFCTEVDLSNWLEAIGPIQNVVIKRDMNGNSLLYGFVHFHSVSSAKRAVRILNGQKFMGRTIIVHDTTTRAPKKDYSRWFKINVYFASYSILKIEEELLHNVFSRFGDVQDVVIRDHTVHPLIEGLQWVCGYGVVFFTSEDDAIQAVQCMDNYVAEMVHFTCTYRGRVSQVQQNEDQVLILDSRGSDVALCSPLHPHQQLSLLQRRWLGYAENSPLVIRESLKKSVLTSVATSSAFMTIAPNISTFRDAISFTYSPSMLPPPKNTHSGKGPRVNNSSKNVGYVSNYLDHISSSRNLYPPPQQLPSSHMVPPELPHFLSTANSTLPPRDVMISRPRLGFLRHDQSASSEMNNTRYIPDSSRRERNFDTHYRRVNYETGPYAHRNERNFPEPHHFEPNDLDYYQRGHTISEYFASAPNQAQTTRNAANTFDHGRSEASLFTFEQSQQHSREYIEQPGSLYKKYTPPFHESSDKSHLR